MEEKRYYNEYMAATRNFIVSAKDELVKKLHDKGYNIYKPTTHDEPGLGIAIFGNYADSVDNDSNLNSYLYNVDGLDVTVVSCPPCAAEELFKWADNLPVINKSTNFVEHVMTFKTNEEADYVAKIVHEFLKGNKDYISSAILLNIDKNKVTMIIGDEASEDSKRIAISAITYAMYKVISAITYAI